MKKIGVVAIRRHKAVSRLILAAAMVAAAAGLSGCSEALSSGPMTRFSTLMRGYDHTLTQEEQKAAIAELKEDQAKQAQVGAAH